MSKYVKLFEISGSVFFPPNILSKYQMVHRRELVPFIFNIIIQHYLVSVQLLNDLNYRLYISHVTSYMFLLSCATLLISSVTIAHFH